MNVKEKIKNFFINRKYAYKEVFKDDNRYVQIVLSDLAKFCRADKSCFHDDARTHAVLEGRREVWLRIMDHTKLTPEEFWSKYGDNNA